MRKTHTHLQCSVPQHGNRRIIHTSYLGWVAGEGIFSRTRGSRACRVVYGAGGLDVIAQTAVAFFVSATCPWLIRRFIDPHAGAPKHVAIALEKYVSIHSIQCE